MEIVSIRSITDGRVVLGPTQGLRGNLRRRWQILSTGLAILSHASVQSYARHRRSRSIPAHPSAAHGGRVRSAGRPAPARMVRRLRSARPTAGLRRRHRQSPGGGLARDRSRRAFCRLAPPKPQAHPARGRPEPAPARLRARGQAAHAHPRLPLVARPAPRSIPARSATGRLPARAGPRRIGHRRSHHQRGRASALRARTAALPRGGCPGAWHVGRARKGEALWRVLLPARPADGTGLLPAETPRGEDPRTGGELSLPGGHGHVAPERTRRRCADGALRLEDAAASAAACPPLRTLCGVRPRARPIPNRPGRRGQCADLRGRAAAGSGVLSLRHQRADDRVHRRLAEPRPRRSESGPHRRQASNRTR